MLDNNKYPCAFSTISKIVKFRRCYVVRSWRKCHNRNHVEMRIDRDRTASAEIASAIWYGHVPTSHKIRAKRYSD